MIDKGDSDGPIFGVELEITPEEAIAIAVDETIIMMIKAAINLLLKLFIRELRLTVHQVSLIS